MKFGIRPKPIEFESLTGYLERVAYMNGVPFFRLVKLIRKELSRGRGLCTYDFSSKSYANLGLFSKIVDQPLKVIMKMTMQPIYNLFKEFSRDISIAKLLNSKNRFFCPMCLSEGVTHLLIWQVRDIKICHVHHINLKKQCDNCKHIQPYINQKELSRRYCERCEEDLSSKNQKLSEKLSSDTIEEQLNLYESWRYLFGEDISSTPAFIEDRFAYCLRLIYVIENEGEVSNQNGISLIEEEKKLMLQQLKQNLVNYVASLKRTFKIIKLKNISLDKFSNLVIPPEYLQNFSTNFVPKRIGESIKVCLAPWCKSYQYNDSMVDLQKCNNKINRNGIAFFDPAICLDCSMSYGIIGGKVWSEIDCYISKGYHTVLPLLEDGYSINKIEKEEGIPKRKVLRWLGYFANRGLISKSYINEFKPKFSDPKFSVKLIALNKKIEWEANKNYGWARRDFFYYYGSKEVMEHIAFSSAKLQLQTSVVNAALNELKKNKTVINNTSLANLLNVNLQWVGMNSFSEIVKEHRYKQNMEFREEFYQKAENYVKQRYQSRGLCMDEFFKTIGKSREWIVKYYPEYKGWEEEHLKIHKIKYIEHITMRRAEQTSLIIDDLIAAGKKITNQAIAKKLRVSTSTVRKDPYIQELIEKYYMSTTASEK
ncbi:TniQ family protein [Paenibacillus sp. NPDC057934]|uniref:TniQ family protein n=1 Tax=Paenibacillus sp. NPDC057934 TaxID=3346282 RepID=UPI0036DDA359